MAENVKRLDAAIVDCHKTPTRACRDAIVGELRTYIDDYWRRFKSDFNGRVGVANVAIDTATAGLTSAAVIVTQETAKNILAGVATALLAFRSSAQKNLLGEQSAVILIGQMDSDRLVIGARIDAGLDSAIAAYSFTRAMTDISEYGSSLSVISALISMQRAGAANAQKVKDAQANVTLLTTQIQADELRIKAAELAASAARLAPPAAAAGASAVPGR